MIPRIRQIQIQNYKSIERAVVDLEPFTVFVGPNGAGKSNFIDALAFLQDCVSQSLDRAVDDHGGMSVFSRTHVNGRGQPHLGFRLLVDLPENHLADYAFEISWADQPKVARERCLIRAQDGEEWAFEAVESNFTQPIQGIRPLLSPNRFALFAASAAHEFRPLYDFLTSLRLYNVEPKRLRAIQDLHSGDSLQRDGGNAAAVLKRLKETYPRSHERVRELLAVALPGLEDVDYYSLSPGPGGGIRFELNIGRDEPITFVEREVSDGTLRILGLLLAVYQSQRPSVLVIEEPEATVHPAIAELIVQVLFDAARDRQVLMTTHSPDILDAKEFSDDQIRVVTMEEGQTTIAPLSKAHREANQERLYTPGELLRIDELAQDLDAAHEAAQHLDLFPAISGPVSP